MDIEHRDEESIFKAAIKIKASAERMAYLERACGNDGDLLARVEALLKSYAQAGDFLESPPGVERTLDARPVTEGPGTQIGRYKLLQRIGEGGFGVVYMAEQEKPIRRRVALKIIKLGMDTKQVIARFEAERQALAMMEHPNIARVFDGGATETGRPYFVMELVKGMPITQYCDQNNLDTQERLELFVDVCKAVQHAHQKGVIHRDIKPSNVMITLHDGKPVPKVIDFGIAKATAHRLTEKTLFTEYQQFIGTPEYMSPEQAEMSGLDIDTRSDIYSLGVLLYELLTGTTPFEAEKLRSVAYDEIRRIIREDEPPRPSTRLSTLGETLAEIARHRHVQPGELRRIICGDLDWIVMKSLEKDRTRRYETANDLAQDIYRHLSDEPVVAGPPDTVYRIKKFFRRNKTLVTGAGIVLLVLLAGIVVSTIFAIGQSRARRQADDARASSDAAKEKETAARIEAVTARDQALQAKKVAEEEHRYSQRLLAKSLFERGIDLLSKGDGLGMLDLLEAWDTANDSPGLRESIGRLWAIAHDLWAERLVRIMPAGLDQAVSPNGRYLVISRGQTAQLWDMGTWQSHGQPLRLGRGISAAKFSPDSRLLAAHSMEGVSRLWYTATREPIGPILRHEVDRERRSADDWSFEETHRLTAFSPDGKLLATGYLDGAVCLWDTATGQPCGEGIQHRGLRALAFSPDGKLIATSARDQSARLWEVATGKLYRPPLNSAENILFSPDGKLLATKQNASYTIDLRDIETGRLYKQLSCNTSQGHMEFSPDGKLLATACWDWTALIWDIAAGKPFGQTPALVGPVRQVAFSSDGTLLAATSISDITKDSLGILLWDVSAGEPYGPALHSWKPRKEELGFSPDGKFLISPGNWIWRAHQQLRTEIITCQDSAGFGAISPDGKIGASIMGDTVQRWDALTNQVLGEPLTHEGKVTQVAFSPDGKLLACSYGGLTRSPDMWFIQLWEVSTGQPSGSILGVEGHPCSLAFSPDGKQLAAGTTNWKVQILDMTTEKYRKTFYYGGWVLSIGFSPDCKVLATGLNNGIVELLDTDTGDKIGSPLKHRSEIVGLAFSPDGNLLATVSGDKQQTVRIWDIGADPSYKSLALPPLAVQGKKVLRSFSKDGTILVSRYPDGTAQAWRLPTAPTDLREMQLKTWISLGMRRNQKGQITETQSIEWHELRRELARTIPASEPQLSDAADSRGSSNIQLLWTPGSDASAHNVYFGTNPDHLELLGKAEDARYENLPTLDRDTTYWWRVDTLKSDGSVIKGNLWTSRTGKMVGWWKLDGNVTDSAGSGYDGELVNGGQWVDGRIGGALQFDGEDDFVSLPIGTLLSTLNRATIMLWVNFSNEGGAWQRVFDFGTDQTNYIYVSPRTGVDGPMHTSMTTSGGGFANFDANSGTLASGWHHLAVMIEPDNLQLYLDGEVVGSTSALYTLSDLGVTTNNWLGRSQYAADAFFKGSMDDLRIYNYAMSQAEAAAIYAGREPKLPDKPKWFFTVKENELAPPESPVDSRNVYCVPLKSEQDLHGQ